MHRAREMVRRRQAVAISLVIIISVWAPIFPAGAAEFGTGVYLLGYQSSLAGYMPDPGFYLRNDFYVYQGNAPVMPFARRVELYLRSRWITDLIAGCYVTPLKIFGANYAVGLIWSSVTNSFLKGDL